MMVIGWGLLPSYVFFTTCIRAKMLRGTFNMRGHATPGAVGPLETLQPGTLKTCFLLDAPATQRSLRVHLCFQSVETAPKLDSEKSGVCIGVYSVFKGCACRRGG